MKFDFENSDHDDDDDVDDDDNEREDNRMCVLCFCAIDSTLLADRFFDQGQTDP